MKFKDSGEGKIECIYSDNIREIKKMRNKVSVIFVNHKLGLLFIGFKFGTILIYDLENTTITNGYISQLEVQDCAIEVLSHGRLLVSKDKNNNIFMYDISLARPNIFMGNKEQVISLHLPNDVRTQWSIS